MEFFFKSWKHCTNNNSNTERMMFMTSRGMEMICVGYILTYKLELKQLLTNFVSFCSTKFKRKRP